MTTPEIDTLRRASQAMTERAAEMRAAFPDYPEPDFLDAVATWLEKLARASTRHLLQLTGIYGTKHAADFLPVDEEALTIARTFLGEES